MIGWRKAFSALKGIQIFIVDDLVQNGAERSRVIGGKDRAFS
jgi:hypothetical protein